MSNPALFPLPIPDPQPVKTPAQEAADWLGWIIPIIAGGGAVVMPDSTLNPVSEVDSAVGSILDIINASRPIMVVPR